MTWQLASYLLLFVALAAGFAWYERSDPSAKLLALVATLAALAVLGRVAFWAIPNVKPTTDIVLLSGYVLGGAPGFAVGAVSALASNVFFGQGPFTPWQMAGWGAVGLFGALLARSFGRDLGRWPLALACGLAGLAYGGWMDLHLWVTYTDHRLAEYGVIAGRGVPFNVAHAVGNVLFCLAFGPALVRALGRFRDRFEITWRPAPAATTACVALLAAVVVVAPASAADRAVTRAASYLASAQTANGGFASAKGGSSANEMHSGWAIIGLAAAGRHPADVRRGSASAAAYIAGRASQVSYSGDISRTILALRAAGRPAGALATKLEQRQRESGSTIGLVNQTAFAVMALRAAGRSTGSPAVRDGVAYLLGEQNADGGFNFGGKGGPSGIDDTASVLQALAAGGKRGAPAFRRGVRWLVKRQGPDGGYPLAPGQPSNAQSTAFAVQALVAAGRNPARVRRNGSRSPIAYLRSLQNADGSIRYSRTSRQTPVWVTAQALAALARKSLPVRAPRRARKASAASAAPSAAAAEAPAAAEPEADEPEESPRKRRSDGPRATAALADDARRAGALTARVLGTIVA